jgi:hypothetical protein
LVCSSVTNPSIFAYEVWWLTYALTELDLVDEATQANEK